MCGIAGIIGNIDDKKYFLIKMISVCFTEDRQTKGSNNKILLLAFLDLK